VDRSFSELQAISCYRDSKEARQATHAISTTSRHMLSLIIFFLQSKAPKEIHAILTQTVWEHAKLYATVKN
jgi:hypothetical protein